MTDEAQKEVGHLVRMCNIKKLKFYLFFEKTNKQYF